MNNKTTFFLTAFFLIGLVSFAQTKKWTLEECVFYAVENNISIQQSELDLQNAKIDKNSALGNFLPSLNAGANHSWNIGLNQNITTGLLENQTTQFSSVSLNSSIDIYNGLQNQNRLRRAKLSELASQYNLSKIQDDISLSVANAYLNILFNKENLKVQQAQLVNDEQQLTRSEELVKAGSIPRGDLLDVKATVALDKQKILAAENTLLISKLSLAQLLQLEDFKNFDIVEENLNAEQSATLLEKPQTIYGKALEHRIEIKVAKTNLEVAEKDVKIAKGTMQPSLTGFYSFSTRASYSDRIIGIDGGGNPIVAGPLPLFDQFSDNKGHNFGLQLNVPILNGFSARNNVAKSKVNYERTKNAYNQAELDLERNVYTAFTDANAALKTYEAAVSTLEAREEAFNYAKEKFAVGMMNAFDYNQAQLLYTNAQSDLIRAKYDYIFKEKVVELYFGIPILKKP
ncbi:TolC family protein [Flavobacterium solisilvae]|uniref:TolC family protein n=1 Tax=Flavobacterium solisilvae TaxID=1852019 RepID=A0ABX1QRH1_9FLAO|nr:TolC family protein [Flavobacterium solisilvae]NMH23913.1 TolC family protein [Flavobacterium solisilvae]